MSSPAPSAAKVRVPSTRSLVAGATLLLLIVAAYFPVRQNAFIWDDDAYITRNTSLRSLEGLGQIWLQPTGAPQYYPLVHTSFWIEFHLWGFDPRGYHAVNVGLHAISALLLWRLLHRLGVGRRDNQSAANPEPGTAQAFSFAWLVAAIFAVHPVCVESVAWATERKNVLMLVCYLLAAHAYVRFSRLDEAPAADSAVPAPRRWPWYALAVLAFIAAMFSKTVACSFGPAMGLLIYWKRGRVRLADLLSLVPFLIVGLTLGLFTAWLERHHVGALGAEWDLSFIQRTLIAGKALWFYFYKLLWPANLCFIYERWPIDARAFVQWLYPLAAAGFVLTLWLARKKLGRGPFVAVAFFGVTIFPALGFLNIYPMRYTWAADHYQYVACVGLITFALGCVSALLRRLGSVGVALGRGLALAVLLGLAFLTHRQTKNYQDLKTLWVSVLTKNPGAAIAWNNLGTVLLSEGDDAQAMQFFTRAVALDERHHEAHNNLAFTLNKAGDAEGAIAHLRRAIKANPDYVDALNNLGLMLAMRGQPDEAAAHLAHAAEIEPNKAHIWANLAQALRQQNKTAEAIECFRRALTLDPDNVAAMTNLARTLLQAGRRDDALAWYRQAMESSPDDPALRREYFDVLLAQPPTQPATQPGPPR